MKDLDFDELDKAVNSLMSGVPKDPGVDAPNEKTVTLPDTPTEASVEVESTPVRSASSATTSGAQSTGSLAARRGGRFMDVVHPSANMKQQPVKAVSRQAATIAPISNDVAPTPPVVEEPSAPTDSPVEDTPELTPHQPQATSDWPDPLDMMTKSDETSTEMDSSSDKASESLDQPAADAAPLVSPFLPDAKVEKRPLGGASSADAPELPVQSMGKEDLTVNNPEAQLPPTPAEPEVALPEELQGDLVAIESGSAKETLHDDKPEIKEAAPKKDDYARQPEVAPEPKGPVSIPKQYKEEPGTDDQQSGAIYDTDTYHQPLAHPVKKKSGWLMVLWIVLVIALGAAIGAALFFFGII